MPSHSKCFRLYKIRMRILPDLRRNSTHFCVHFENIISINFYGLYAICRPLLYKTVECKLLVYRCGKGVSIVLDEKNNRKFPYGCQIERFMKITFAGAAFT